jgi:uncharacterized Rmd1/YagE family protein
VAPRVHQFYAIAFVENLSLRALAPAFPTARVSPHEIYIAVDDDAGLYIYPFGAVVMHDVPPQRREDELKKLHQARPGLTTQVIREDYAVREDSSLPIGIKDGILHVDRMTPARASIVALTMAQSAAMEYYERIVEALFERTNVLAERLEKKGTVPFSTRPLHRFIGEAITNRTEVLSVLHLLDKPDATWDDPAMDRIYADLRAEFDLVDRYAAMELKLRSIQEALELVLDVARDRRLLTLEIVVAVLILIELVFAAMPFV